MLTVSLSILVLSLGQGGAPKTESPGLRVYRSLGLPLPPSDAKLVQVESYADVGGRTTAALLWRVKSKGSFSYLGGPTRYPDDDPRGMDQKRFHAGKPITEKEALDLDLILCPLYNDFDADLRLGFALQAEAMGMKRLSEKMLAEKFSLRRRFIDSPDESIEDRVHEMAFFVSLAELKKPQSDRRAITARLEMLAERLPKDKYSLAWHYLEGQQAALAPRQSPSGSVKALLDQLVDLRTGPSRFGIYSYADGELDSLLRRGLEIVPELMAHRSDKRATLIFSPGLNNFRSGFSTVGEICSVVLAQLMSGRFVNRGWLDEDQDFDKWWQSAKSKTEYDYLVSVLFPKPSDEQSSSFPAPPNPVALRMLTLRFPNSIGSLYKLCLARPDCYSYTLAEAVAESTMPKSEKLALFDLSLTSQSAEHRDSGIRFATKVEPDAASRLLIGALSAPKPFGDGPYWISPAKGLAASVQKSKSPAAFAALAKAMKEAELGYRVEAMSTFWSTAMAREDPEIKRLAVALLEQFLNDEEAYDPKKDGFAVPGQGVKWQGPGALMQFKTVITGQDFACLCIASIIGEPHEDSTAWTRGQWDPFRKRASTKLFDWKKVN